VLSQAPSRKHEGNDPFPSFTNRAKTVFSGQGAHLKKNYMQQNIEVGRYLVSPMTSSHIDGGFSASVSIRSGRGTGTTDRIMRFVPRFPNRQAALRYATAEGLSWVSSH